MQRILTLIIGTLALWLCSLSLAQVAQPVELIKGVSPATITLIVIVGSSFLAHWLTALTKGRLGTEGRTTQLLAGGFSALTGGLITFRSGLYGEGWTALLVALLVSLVTWAAADAQWRGKVQAATAALQGLQQSGGLPKTVLPNIAPLPSNMSSYPDTSALPTAYDIARANGFQGDQAAWLLSLKSAPSPAPRPRPPLEIQLCSP